MNTGYTPVQGRGFVRPGETKKPCYRVFSGIKKAAPIRNRLSEQLTCCEKIGSVQGNYINRVTKRHNCRITGKTKATRYGGHSTQATRYPQRMSIANNATFAAGGQSVTGKKFRWGYSCSLASPYCDVFQVCDPIFVRLYSLRNFSRTNAHGANLSCSCLLTAFLRCFFLDEDNFFNDLSVIVDTCNPVRHSSPHHGAGDGYSCSLALRRWRRLISPRMAALINCPVLSPSSFTFSMPSIISWAIRAVTDCDLAFFGPVAMSNSLCFWCKTIYTKKNYFEGLTCKTPLFYIVSYTLLMQGTETTKPRTVGAVTGLLTTNDRKRIEVAMRNHTTHPQGRDSHNLNKYIWRFIALSTAQPRVITIEATSEQEARQQSPDDCVMVFAARIRQGVRHA
ncbi:host cell division inhibitor Icd-like protein [Escherichia coli]|nr:host cell division inhibitor Icd-like protein [Escherichia coli]EJP1859634.1 host cell division inhibitor Icd-like protein [Escherichia coli]ELE0097761.1 host cell division inhibitor Icd-like protein [Escherichia coli]